MRHTIFTMTAVTMIATAAFAQTTTTTGTDAAGGTFGTTWPLSIGTTFLTDADTATLRSTEEITAGWQSLSQEDRDMVLAECRTFMEAHGDAAATGSTSTSTDTATGTSTDAGAATTATTGTDAQTTENAGYDMAEMKAICEAADKL